MKSTWHVAGSRRQLVPCDGGLTLLLPGACPSWSQSPESGVAMVGICPRRENVTWHRGGQRARAAFRYESDAECIFPGDSDKAHLPRSCRQAGLLCQPVGSLDGHAGCTF